MRSPLAIVHRYSQATTGEWSRPGFRPADHFRSTEFLENFVQPIAEAIGRSGQVQLLAFQRFEGIVLQLYERSVAAFRLADPLGIAGLMQERGIRRLVFTDSCSIVESLLDLFEKRPLVRRAGVEYFPIGQLPPELLPPNGPQPLTLEQWEMLTGTAEPKEAAVVVSAWQKYVLPFYPEERIEESFIGPFIFCARKFVNRPGGLPAAIILWQALADSPSSVRRDGRILGVASRLVTEWPEATLAIWLIMLARDRLTVFDITKNIENLFLLGGDREIWAGSAILEGLLSGRKLDIGEKRAVVMRETDLASRLAGIKPGETGVNLESAFSIWLALLSSEIENSSKLIIFHKVAKAVSSERGGAQGTLAMHHFNSNKSKYTAGINALLLLLNGKDRGRGCLEFIEQSPFRNDPVLADIFVSALRLQGRDDEAIAHCDRTLPLVANGSREERRYLYVDISGAKLYTLLIARRWEECLVGIRSLIEYADRNNILIPSRIRLIEAYSLEALGRLDEALAVARRVLADDPRSIKAGDFIQKHTR